MSGNEPPEGAIQPPAKYAVHKHLGWMVELDKHPLQDNSVKHNTSTYWFFNNYWHAWGYAIRHAATGIDFVMVEQRSNLPLTGATVSAVYSVDGGPFKCCSNQVYEIGDGVYGINLKHEMTQGHDILLHFTAPGAADTNLLIARPG